MKALLLAAGFGSRLGEITQKTPKPLVKVGNAPIIAYCLDELARSGVTEVVINTHYLADQIESFIDNYKTPLAINLSYENNLLGTAGTLKKHFENLATDDFIVMHADNYFIDPIINLVASHKSRVVGKYGTLGTFITNSPENCGVLILNPDKTIKEFHEKVSNPPSNIANAAIYCFTPDISKQLFDLSSEENDISKHLIPKIMNGLYTHSFEGLFVDIGTLEGLRLANLYEVELSRSTTN